jgi:hypothetical protein
MLRKTFVILWLSGRQEQGFGWPSHDSARSSMRLGIDEGSAIFVIQSAAKFSRLAKERLNGQCSIFKKHRPEDPNRKVL